MGLTANAGSVFVANTNSANISISAFNFIYLMLID
jgi:hypothetical protein